MLHGIVAAVSDIDPELLGTLIPEPFLSIKPGDQVTLFVPPLDFGIPEPAAHLKRTLEQWAPEVSWCVVEGVGIAGVIHVARDDRTPQP